MTYREFGRMIQKMTEAEKDHTVKVGVRNEIHWVQTVRHEYDAVDIEDDTLIMDCDTVEESDYAAA